VNITLKSKEEVFLIQAAISNFRF